MKLSYSKVFYPNSGIVNHFKMPRVIEIRENNFAFSRFPLSEFFAKS